MMMKINYIVRANQRRSPSLLQGRSFSERWINEIDFLKNGMKNAKSNMQICADLKNLPKELLKILDEKKIDKNKPTSGGVPRATVQPLAKKRRWWRVLSYRFLES